MTYYANQNTGESSWDPPSGPMSALQPAATYLAQPASSQTQTLVGTVNGAASSVTTTQKVASKYGDGFVTSASHPQLAEQYGNVGTR